MDYALRFDRAPKAQTWPAALVDDVMAFARLTPADLALDVGCGAGEAAAAFARRGASLVALEADPDLFRRARARLSPFPDAACLNVELRDWRGERGAFDLVYAADAWAWSGARARFVEAARLLRTGGTLALFGRAPPGPGLPEGPLALPFEASGLFDPVTFRRYDLRPCGCSVLYLARKVGL